VSGRNIIEALINGEVITKMQLLSMVKGSVKNKVDDLANVKSDYEANCKSVNVKPSNLNIIFIPVK
jgi:hypothetical protein